MFSKQTQERISRLPIDEYSALSSWTYPANLPDGMESRLLDIIDASGQTVSTASLDAAAQTIITENTVAAAAFKKFLAEAPAGLKDAATGYLTQENAAVMGRILEESFGNVITSENLKAAFEQATAARQLRWKQVTETTKSMKPQDRANALAGTGVHVDSSKTNHAAGGAEGKAAWDEYLSKVPPGLLNADGDFDRGNYDRANEIIQNEMGGKLTLATISAALQLMNARKTLVWFQKPRTAEEKAKDLLAEESRKRLEDEHNNKLGQKTIAERVTEGEQQAREEVAKLYKNADAVTQANIKRIIDADLAAKRTPLITLNEVQALLSINTAFNYPPGPTHNVRDLVRSGISRILHEELTYRQSHPEDSGTYTRAARRVVDLIEKGESEGVETGYRFSRSIS